jgi:thioredoxin 1
MDVEHLTKTSYEEKKDSDVPMIMDFWAAWCPPCQLMGPVFEEASKDYDGKLRFAKVDVDSERELAIAFGVASIPTLVLVHKGKEVGRLTGFMPKDALKQKIDGLLSDLDRK